MSKSKKQQEPIAGPWLSMRTGLQINILVSVGLAIFVGWQIYPAGGLPQALLWGIVAGLSIWMIFLATYLFSIWTRRQKGE